MTDDMGVVEGVAAPQAESEVQQPSDQEINWQKANETMAEQKRALEEAQRQNQTYQQQLNVFQNYLNQQQQQPAQTAAPLDDFNDDDVVTGADMKRAMSRVLEEKEKAFQQQLKAQESQLAVMALRSQYPDYNEVVQDAVKMAENDPQLAEAIRTSSNPGLLAYQLGKARSAAPSQQVAAAQKIVENAQKPGSASQAATGGSALSKVDYFMDMSAKEFEEHIAKVKMGLV
jgi:hypothetical protein